MSVDLSTTIGAVRFRNPVLVASGTFGYGDEAIGLTEPATLGGIVTKTITLEPRAGNRAPRLHETPAGLLNSIGLQNVGVDRFVREKLPKLRELGCPIVVSIGGRTAQEFVEVTRRLEDCAGIAALEINISCPNVKEGGLEFCQDPRAAAAVVAEVRKHSERPLWAKLSPNVTSIGALAKTCEEAGADALTAVNTFVGLALDIESGEPYLPGGTGGLSGPAIRPLALAKVREVVRSSRLPVVGVGGIVTASDALEFLVVGARAVQVGTASFREPGAAALAVRELERYAARRGHSSLEPIIGSYRDPR